MPTPASTNKPVRSWTTCRKRSTARSAVRWSALMLAKTVLSFALRESAAISLSPLSCISKAIDCSSSRRSPVSNGRSSKTWLWGTPRASSHLPNNTSMGGQAGLGKNIKKEGQKLFGSPAIDVNQYLRSYAVFKNLPDLSTRLRHLEEKMLNLPTN